MLLINLAEYRLLMNVLLNKLICVLDALNFLQKVLKFIALEAIGTGGNKINSIAIEIQEILLFQRIKHTGNLSQVL